MRNLSFIVLVLTFLVFPNNLFAIHAIFKGVLPIPRIHGPAHLNMVLETFRERVNSTELSAAIGQFSDEHRFDLNRSGFSSKVTQVLADFYKDRLFRIEINYKPLSSKSADIESLIENNNASFGPPRENILPGTRLIFWDDGATRLILQIDDSDGFLSYSLTYIDNDLFHAASRDRVQRETAGRSNYGK